MDKRLNKYDRVMPRVYNRSRSGLKSKSHVMRHDTPSSAFIGAKPSVSNVSSGVFSDLPIVLNDYSPEVTTRRKFVVKPRKTLKSLDPALSPHRSAPRSSITSQKVSYVTAGGSAPAIWSDNVDKLPSSPFRQCHSSRSHTNLKELRNEIKAYQTTEKHMKLRSRLFKSCGVVLDDVGRVAADKSVQAHLPETDNRRDEIRSERSAREDARTAVLDQQMRSNGPQYPVDRYLVDSNKKVEMVNIIDDDIWNPEPALKPEDEIILRKLHDMLQATADDLKSLSGELSKFHEPRVQIKSQPTPMDEEFNEKVHIEEIVNAKFHGYKIVNKSLPYSPEPKPNKDILNSILGSKFQNPKFVNAGVQVNSVSNLRKTTFTKKLQMTRPKVVQIKEDSKIRDHNILNNGKLVKKVPTVTYNEITYNYIEQKEKSPEKKLQIQKMPGINIRCELKEQKVLHLDILPVLKDEGVLSNKNNIGVIELQHESDQFKQVNPSPILQQQNYDLKNSNDKHPARKISKMSTCESSESTNNASSDTIHKLEVHKQIKLALKSAPKSSARIITKKKEPCVAKKQEKRPHLNLDEWKRKLNAVYGQSSSSKHKYISPKVKNKSPKKLNIPLRGSNEPKPHTLNNTEYIPYTKLTLGGVSVSDIEKEIPEVSLKNDLPLSPIIDKILNSRESSFNYYSPRRNKISDSPKILTTSDENLLQEVIDIEQTVSETLSKKFNKTLKKSQISQNNSISPKSSDGDSSYADDFEDEKSDRSASSNKSASKKSQSNLDSDGNNSGASEAIENNKNENTNKPETNVQNTTYTKGSNLTIKSSVDIFEFVHSVDTQETGTQSNSASKISLKETQTSPRNDKSNVQPIHNDLWPIDPKGEVEKLFQLEKDFIKKLIIDEYGDILEESINKPSTSKQINGKDRQNNVAAAQKNTQTSPAHVKCVMTSPTRTKTRTTSPFSLSLTVDRQTSPMIVVTNEDDLNIEIENDADDLGISVNLSSPRFSLRLPQTTREVLSNIDNLSRTSSKIEQKVNSQAKLSKYLNKNTVTSSSSVDADNSSSEISSLGEVRLKLRRKIRKSRFSSETSSSSLRSRYSSGAVSGEILPLKSEGELSLGQTAKKPSRYKNSDGEMNF